MDGRGVSGSMLASLAARPALNKGLVVSIGDRAGVADVAGITLGGRLAHGLEDAIEWEYRQSVRYLHGFAAG